VIESPQILLHYLMSRITQSPANPYLCHRWRTDRQYGSPSYLVPAVEHVFRADVHLDSGSQRVRREEIQCEVACQRELVLIVIELLPLVTRLQRQRSQFHS